MGKAKSRKKLNCWEFKGCGMEKKEKVSGMDACPASRDTRLDGVHGGKMAGRACWVIAGTMCADSVLGSFAQNYVRTVDTCVSCDFYQKVRDEEGGDFIYSGSLLLKLLTADRRNIDLKVPFRRRLRDLIIER